MKSSCDTYHIAYRMIRCEYRRRNDNYRTLSTRLYDDRVNYCDKIHISMMNARLTRRIVSFYHDQIPINANHGQSDTHHIFLRNLRNAYHSFYGRQHRPSAYP